MVTSSPCSNGIFTKKGGDILEYPVDFPRNIRGISLGYPQGGRYPRNILGISQGYARDISGIFPEYPGYISGNIPGMCQGYPRDIRIIFPCSYLRGSDWAKWLKLSNFCFLLKKCLQVWGITSQIFRGLAALELPQNRGQRVFFFFSFSIEMKKKMEKIFFTFYSKSFKDSKTFFSFHSSIKTVEVLFFFIYLYIYKSQIILFD